jgi:hypothetical protein
MDTSTLKEILINTLAEYTGEALNGYSYLTSDASGQLFTIVSVGGVHDKRVVDTGLVVQLHDEQIVIEHDVNDKPLVDALIQAGVPREKIVLAYSGEPVQANSPLS